MGTYHYNRGAVSIACGTVGFPSGSTDTVYREVVDVLKDERVVKPVPLSNTNMEIWRKFNNASRVVRGSRYGSVGYTHSGLSSTYTVEETSGLSNVINQARKRLGAGKYNLGVTLVEFDDTCRTIKSGGLRVIGALRHLLNRRPDRSATQLGVKLSRRKGAKIRDALEKSDFNGAWLEMQFGWLPILNDIYGASEALRDGMATRGLTVNGSAGSRWKRRTSNIRNTRNVRFNSSVGITMWDDSDPLLGQKLARRAAFTGRVSNPNLRTLQELGLINPAHLAWQRLTYSFVIDWILPIGDMLAAMTAGAGLVGVRGYSIREWRQTKKYSNGTWDYTYSKIYREHATFGGLPDFRIDTLSAWHMATSFALASKGISSSR